MSSFVVGCCVVTSRLDRSRSREARASLHQTGHVRGQPTAVGCTGPLTAIAIRCAEGHGERDSDKEGPGHIGRPRLESRRNWRFLPSQTGSVEGAYGNGVAEAVFVILKCPRLNRRSFRSQAGARVVVCGFIKRLYIPTKRYASPRDLGYRIRSHSPCQKKTILHGNRRRKRGNFNLGDGAQHHREAKRNLFSVGPNQARQHPLDLNAIRPEDFCLIERIAGFKCDGVASLPDFLQRRFGFVDQGDHDVTVIEV